METQSFRDYLNKNTDNLDEETTSADIATVDNKLNISSKSKTVKRPCLIHGKINCQECNTKGEKGDSK